MLQIRPVSILNFFEVQVPFYKYVSKKNFLDKKYLLSSFSKYLEEENFVKFYAAFDDSGLYFHVIVESSFTKVNPLEYSKGDCIEIFVDTKDLKTKGYLTKYCHHFVFFPNEMQNIYGKEITRFRADDMHKLAISSDLKVESGILKDSYNMNIFIPQNCLHGYDPKNFDRLGFNYRINRFNKLAAHFSVSSKEYVIERNPYLWATLLMEQK